MNDAGRIGFVVRGEYDSSATYDFLDVVLFGNSSYVAKKLTIGNTPAENSEYWQVLAKTPDSGVTGLKGNAEEAYRTGQVNLALSDILPSGTSSQYLRGDGVWSSTDVFLQKVIKVDNTDVDAIYQTGIYRSSTWINSPGSDAQGTLIVINYNGNVANGWYKHIFISPHTNSILERIHIGSTYNNWGSSDNATSATKAVQDGNGNNIAETYTAKNETGGISVGEGLTPSTSEYYELAFTSPTFNAAGVSFSGSSGGDFNFQVDIWSNGHNYDLIPYLGDNIYEIADKIIFNSSDSELDGFSGLLDGIIDIYFSSPNEIIISGRGETAYRYFEKYNAYNPLQTNLPFSYSFYNKKSISAPPYQSLLGTNNKNNVYEGIGAASDIPVLEVGNGSSSSAKSNAMRLMKSSNMYLGAGGKYNSSGADYAEFIKPWADGNPASEDRVGYFVTIKEGLLCKANAGDYIVGIISGNPSIVGNSDEDYYWRYERDEFNRIIMEDSTEMVQQTDEDGNLVFDEETEASVMAETRNIIPNARMKLAEDYDPSLQSSYVERKDRKEWDYVGMVGVLPVRDDGTCIAGQYCKCGQDGIAELATERGFDTFYVIERINDHVVSVILK